MRMRKQEASVCAAVVSGMSLFFTGPSAYAQTSHVAETCSGGNSQCFDFPSGECDTDSATLPPTFVAPLRASFIDDGNVFDGFDSYAPGSSIHGPGAWQGWDNVPALAGTVTDLQSRSAPHSLSIQGTNDTVLRFYGTFCCKWRVTAWMYIPSTAQVDTYFILLNDYVDGGPYSWSTMVRFSSTSNSVTSDFDGTTLPTPLSALTDRWFEIRVDIDNFIVGATQQTIYIDGVPLLTESWHVTHPGWPAGTRDIAALDLWASNSDEVFYDDIMLQELVSLCQQPFVQDGCDFDLDGDVTVTRPLEFSGVIETQFCAEAGAQASASGTTSYEITDEMIAFSRTDQSAAPGETVDVRVNMQYWFTASGSTNPPPPNSQGSGFMEFGYGITLQGFASGVSDALSTSVEGNASLDSGWVDTTSQWVTVPLDTTITLSMRAESNFAATFDTCASCGSGSAAFTGGMQWHLAENPFSFQGAGTYRADSPNLLIANNTWPQGDCNGDGIPDSEQLGAGDCNGNLILDECELSSGDIQDCNSNTIPDECDISSGGSSDCTGDGIPDECQPDCNNNGVADVCDLASGTSQDCNTNNIPDECDIAAAQPMFLGLGDLPGGSFSSTAWRISGDGTTVTGWSTSANGTEAFHWTQTTGMQGLGDLPGCGFNSFGGGVSQDGSVIGGGGESTVSCGGEPGDPNEWEPFRWTQPGGMVALGDLPGGGYYGYVNGVSSDGNFLAGWSGGTVGSSTGNHAFSWTQATGLQPLPEIPGGYESSFAVNVCGNGPVIVGQVSVPGAGFPAYWPSSSENPVQLGPLAGGANQGNLLSCSDDASLMVGWGMSANGPEALYWTSGTGVVGLGDLPGGSFASQADGVSADGSIIVGYANSAAGKEAVLWDASRIIHRVADILSVNGVSVPAGWVLEHTRDVAINNNIVTLTGFGTNPIGDREGWIARYPQGGAPPPDCDDGNVCTDDSCDPIAGCVNTNNVAPCDDGDACTTGDTCAAGICVGGAAPDCNDGNVCTDDACDPIAGCTNTDNVASCDDGEACTSGDTCTAGVCVGGPPPDCNDGNVCTDDSCDPVTGCVNTNNVAPCDDGDACTTGDTCAAGICVGGAAPDCNDGNVCTDDACDPIAGCTNTDNAAPCDDGEACTSGDTCTAGVCVGGPPPDCNDGNVCTDDSCDPVTGCESVSTTPPGMCCNPADGAFTAIDDGLGCTDDLCNSDGTVNHADNCPAGFLCDPILNTCVAPISVTFESVGLRQLDIAPTGGGSQSYALRISGDSGDPAVACVAGFVQDDGSLGLDPVLHSTAEWGGSVHVVAPEILPGTQYLLEVIGENVPPPLTTVTWPWGDVNGNLVANLEDVQIVVLAFQGTFGFPLENMDFDPCEGNGAINFADVLRDVFAFQGQSYVSSGCSTPCGGGLAGPVPAATQLGVDADLGSELILEATWIPAPRSKTAGAGRVIDVDVLVRGAVDLRAYQVAVSATPMDRTEPPHRSAPRGLKPAAQVGMAPLELDFIRVDRDRPDYVFGRREVIDAVDSIGGRVGGLSMAGGVNAIDPRYLATFTFHAPPDTVGEFNFAIDFDETFLLSSTCARISAQAGTAARMVVIAP